MVKDSSQFSVCGTGHMYFSTALIFDLKPEISNKELVIRNFRTLIRYYFDLFS